MQVVVAHLFEKLLGKIAQSVICRLKTSTSYLWTENDEVLLTALTQMDQCCSTNTMTLHRQVTIHLVHFHVDNHSAAKLTPWTRPFSKARNSHWTDLVTWFGTCVVTVCCTTVGCKNQEHLASKMHQSIQWRKTWKQANRSVPKTKQPWHTEHCESWSNYDVATNVV